MTYRQLIPQNTGGGRSRKAPAATFRPDGQLTLNHAAADLLGEPGRVRVFVDADARRIRLEPTTPADGGGWSLSGGGNAQRRIGLRQLAKDHPEMAGDYSIHKLAGGIELRRKVEDDG